MKIIDLGDHHGAVSAFGRGAAREVQQPHLLRVPARWGGLGGCCEAGSELSGMVPVNCLSWSTPRSCVPLPPTRSLTQIHLGKLKRSLGPVALER